MKREATNSSAADAARLCKRHGWRSDVVGYAALTVLATAGSLPLCAATAAAANNYIVTWLGTLGGSSSHAFAIDKGQVVGGSALTSSALPQHAFSWTESGGMVDLGTLPGDENSLAHGVSNGQVVGDSYGPNATRPFSWTAAGGMVPLPLPSDGCEGFAEGVSDGVAVGHIDCQMGSYDRAVAWMPGGGIAEIATGAGHGGAWALGTNKGLVVGSIGLDAFVWNGSSLTLLPAPGGFAQASGVDDGLVVGQTDGAFVWTPGGGMVTIGSPDSAAWGVSNGQVVGRLGDSTAFSWTLDGGLVLLSSFVGGGEALAVSYGQIVGDGTHNGASEAFLLTPSTCGDGITQSSEQCDDGNANNNDSCKNDCTLAICSDGVIETGVEECDDGNLLSGDGCDTMCHTETIVQSTAAAGGTVASATTSVTSPTGGAVKIVETSTVGTPPVGYGFVGKQVNLTAPPGTAEQPLVLTFNIAAADLPTGIDHTNVQLTKNGAVVAECTGAPGLASPNPCVSARIGLPNGDAQLTVLTSTASVWVANAPLCGGVTVTGPKLTLNKLNTLPGDDKLSFTGTFSLRTPVTPALDPLTNGIRVLLQNAAATILDVTIPGGALVDPKHGAGWKVNTAGPTWTYTDKRTKPLAGIYQMVVQDQSKQSPGQVKLTVKGKNGSYGVAPETLPVWGQIALPPSGQQCAVATFAGPAPAPLCTFNKSRSTLTCK